MSEQPRPRRAARVIVLDPEDRLLMFRGHDPVEPELGYWWFTPGGGVEDGESDDEAATRELYEETGIRVDDPGPVVARRETQIRWTGVEWMSQETFFLVHVPVSAVAATHLTQLELDSDMSSRWLTLDELRALDEPVYPTKLPDLVAALASDGRPLTPWELGA